MRTYIAEGYRRKKRSGKDSLSQKPHAGFELKEELSRSRGTLSLQLHAMPCHAIIACSSRLILHRGLMAADLTIAIISRIRSSIWNLSFGVASAPALLLTAPSRPAGLTIGNHTLLALKPIITFNSTTLNPFQPRVTVAAAVTKPTDFNQPST